MAYPQASPYKSGGSGGGGGSNKRTGLVRRNGRAVLDDGGEFYPFGATMMWSLQGAHNEPQRYKENVDWLASKGFDFKRPLTEVDWGPVNGFPMLLDPQNQPWWRPTLEHDIDYSHSVGIRSGITLRGKGTGVDHIWLAREVADIISADREEKVLCCEMENEYSNGGDPLEELIAMAREMAGRIPNLLALSCPGNPAEVEQITEALTRYDFEIFIRHLERMSRGDYGWRDVRQGYDHHNDVPFIGANWEPTGPGSSVSQNTNPLQLAMLRAVSILCGAPIFVFHSGTGVGLPNPAISRPPNFWEIDNIDAIVDAIRNVAELIPQGVPNWTVANTQWVHPLPVAPFQPHAHWEGDHGDGVNKAYSALAPDGRVIQMPCGVRGHALMTASFPLKEVTVYDPLSRQPVSGFENLSFPKGGQMDLPGGGLNAQVAYIIHGKRA